VFEVRELLVRHHGVAVRRAELAVATGEVVGLLGVGASALVRAVAGELVPAAGSARLDGDELTSLPAAAVAAHRVALVTAADLVASEQTVPETLAAAVHRARLLLVDGLAEVCGPAAYAAVLAALRAVLPGADAMALLAETSGDPAAYDRAYVIRDGTPRPWVAP